MKRDWKSIVGWISFWVAFVLIAILIGQNGSLRGSLYVDAVSNDRMLAEQTELVGQIDSLTFEIFDLEIELIKAQRRSIIEIDAIVTAYAPDSISCYPFNDGLTATGKDASLPGVAVDPNRIPYGSFVVIEGEIYEADDTGISMRRAEGLHIDLRLGTHEEAVEWGRDTLTVQIIPKGIF